jgi:hypothetical protein
VLDLFKQDKLISKDNILLKKYISIDNPSPYLIDDDIEFAVWLKFRSLDWIKFVYFSNPSQFGKERKFIPSEGPIDYSKHLFPTILSEDKNERMKKEQFLLRKIKRQGNIPNLDTY